MGELKKEEKAHRARSRRGGGGIHEAIPYGAIGGARGRGRGRMCGPLLLRFVVRSAGARKDEEDEEEVLTWPLSPRHCSKTPGA